MKSIDSGRSAFDGVTSTAFQRTQEELEASRLRQRSLALKDKAKLEAFLASGKGSVRDVVEARNTLANIAFQLED